jgi:hypothetical protein
MRSKEAISFVREIDGYDQQQEAVFDKRIRRL